MSRIEPSPFRSLLHRKEGVSTRAPSLGRGCRAQRGGVGFLFVRRSRLLFAFPIGKSVVLRKAVDRVLSLMVHLRRSSSLSFIPPEPYPARSARHLPHAGKALCQEYRFPHPTSAPSTRSLPLEGAAERSEAGLASFFGGEAASSLPSPLGRLCQGKRYPRFFIHPT